jgi:P-type E1-E2 ATPase
MYYNGAMIELNIAGRETIRLEHLVCDVNGTLALDGKLIEGVKRSLLALKDRLEIHLITADTHGGQAFIDQQLGLEAVRLHPGGEAEQKGSYVQKLGPEHVAAIGQGENDALMLGNAVIGIAILSPEGLALSSLMAADLVVPNILSALELFENPLRMVATLRK